MAAAVSHATPACLLLLLCCCLSVRHLHTVCDAASTAVLQNLTCSTAGNYTSSDAYASNLNQLLAAIQTTKHGGFIKATAGQEGAPGTAYGLALCFADFSLSDCLDCLATATASDSGGLVKQCPGSTTVVATYDRCLVHYSNEAFFGTAYMDIVYTSVLPGPVPPNQVYRWTKALNAVNAFAANRLTRFGYVFPIGGAANLAFILAQCTRDLPTVKCKACLDMLGSRILGSRSQTAVFKTPSCWLRFSSSVTFPVFPPSDAVGEYATSSNFTTMPSTDDATSKSTTPSTDDATTSNSTTPSTDDAASNSTTPSTDDATSNATTPLADASNSTMASTDASKSTPSKNDKGSHRSRRLSTGATVGTVVGVTVGVPSLAVLLVHYLRKLGSRRSSLHNRLEDMRSPEMTPGQGTQQTTESIVQEATQALNSIPVHTGRQFSYQQLLGATENFSHTLGRRGYFGEVFKGVLDGDLVAVKRILLVDEQAQGNYANEINNISQLSHPNLVPLIGSCDENDELLLVYELIPNGSLDQHLYEKEAPLQWDIRYKVAIGIAKALDHLHRQNCIHKDIKPSNVILDEHFNAKLGDFGLVRRIHRPGNTSETMTITGDFGYTDPESIRTGRRAGKASDIYSFGVLLLEIACGIRPTCRQEDPRVNTLIQKARMSYARGALLDAVDERLNGNFVTAQVQLVIRVGLLCVQDESTRPNCRQVLNFLSGTVPPPSPRKDQDSLAIQVHDASDPKEYSYDRLSVATNHFAKIIGSGGFANVYGGKLDQISVAVKQMFRVDDIAIKEFLSEIQVIRQLRHQNLLPLVGWYADKTKLLIVYKLMPKGSLHGHLHQKPTNTLQWNQRFKIITGIASGVAYLHEGSNLQTVLHRNIKPSNVMLDENYTAKLGDFGLVREIGDEVSKKTATFGGTIHYMDPEYFRTLQASKQTDVYSFGVVALEIVLGESPKAFVTKEGQITNTFVQKALRWYEDGTIFHKVDKRLNGNFDEDQMRRVIQAGIMCVNPDRKRRPSCTQVKHYLEGHASEFEPSPSSASMIPQEELIGWGFHAA